MTKITPARHWALQLCWGSHQVLWAADKGHSGAADLKHRGLHRTATGFCSCKKTCKEAENQWIYPSPSLHAQIQLLWGPHTDCMLWVLLEYQQLNLFCKLENEHVVWILFILHEGLQAPIREGFGVITHSVLMFLSIAASLHPDQLWNEVFLFLLFLGYLHI